jgi:hypothetical protein
VSRDRKAELEKVAWQVLSDLFTPDTGFGTLDPDGFQTLVELRLEREAKRLDVPVSELAQAFEKAMMDLTGARRKPPPPSAGTEP